MLLISLRELLSHYALEKHDEDKSTTATVASKWYLYFLSTYYYYYYYYCAVFNAPCVGRLDDEIAGAEVT